MKALKQILLTLLSIGTLSSTSCNDSVPTKNVSPTIKDVKPTVTAKSTVEDVGPAAQLRADALRPLGDTVTLGAIKDFSILIPEQATAQEKYSAVLLSEHLEKILNAKLPMVQEPQAIAGKTISVGNTDAAAAARSQCRSPRTGLKDG